MPLVACARLRTPHRVCFSWDLTTQWQIETNPERASEVEITFTEVTPERTHVELTHRHLDRHGEDWESMRDAVGGGWSRAPLAERLDQANLVGGRYTVVLLRSTDRFQRPAMDPIVWEHGRRNMVLAEAGLLSIVLPVTDDTNLAGIGVFATTSEVTHTILQDDPGIRAGNFTYEIHPVRGFPGASLT